MEFCYCRKVKTLFSEGIVPFENGKQIFTKVQLDGCQVEVEISFVKNFKKNKASNVWPTV